MDLIRSDPQYMAEYMQGYRSLNYPWHKELLKAEQIIHQFLHRSGYTRRQFGQLLAAGLSLPIAKLAFAELIEKWQTARPAQHEQARKDILEMRAMLARGEDVQAHDKAMFLRAMLANDRRPDARRLRIHCYEILRDAGEEGSSGAALTVVRAYARWVRNAWIREKHKLNQAEAQLTEMNLYRSSRDYNNALEILGETDALLTSLKGKREYDQEMVRAVCSQDDLWRFRIVSIHQQNPWAAEREKEHLAANLGTRLDLAETLREEAGHLMMYAELARSFRSRHLDRAGQNIEEALRVFETLPVQPPRIYLTILRAEIEILFMADEKYEAQGIVKEYLKVCREHPIAHCVNQIRSLGEKYRRGMGDLRLDIQDLQHNVLPRHSFMLSYSYLDNRFAKL